MPHASNAVQHPQAEAAAADLLAKAAERAASLHVKLISLVVAHAHAVALQRRGMGVGQVGAGGGGVVDQTMKSYGRDNKAVYPVHAPIPGGNTLEQKRLGRGCWHTMLRARPAPNNMNWDT